MNDTTKSDAASVQRAERLLAEAMLAESPKGMYELVCEAHAILVNAPAIHNESTLHHEASRALRELTQTKEPLPDEIRVSNARHILSDALTSTAPPHDVARDIIAEALTRARSMRSNAAYWRGSSHAERFAKSIGAAEGVEDMAGWIEHGEYNRGSVDMVTKARDALVAAGKAINSATVHTPMRDRNALSDAASAIVSAALDADEFLRRWSKEDSRRRDELAKYQIDYSVLREIESIYGMEASTDLLVAIRRDREHTEPKSASTESAPSTRIFGAMKGSVLRYEEDEPAPSAELEEAREHAEYIVAHEKTLQLYLTHGYRILAHGFLAAVARLEAAAITRETEHGWWRQLLASLGLAMHRASSMSEVWDEFLQAWNLAGIGTSFPQGPGQENDTDPSTAGFERVGGLPMRGGDAIPSLAQVRGLASVDPPFIDDVPCPEVALEKIRDQYPRHHVAVSRCIKIRNETHSIHFVCARIDGGRPNLLLVLRDDHLDGVYSEPLTIAEVVHTMTNITQPERVVIERRVPGCFPPPACPDDRERLRQAMHAVTLDQLDAAANRENLASLLALVARTPSLLDAALSHALEIRDAQPHDSFRDSDHPLVLRAMAILHNETRPTPIEPQWVVNDNAELGVRVNGRFYFLYKGQSLEYENGLHDDNTPRRWRPVGKREFGECCHPLTPLCQALEEIREEIAKAELLEYQGADTQLGYARGARFALDKFHERMATPRERYTQGGDWHDLLKQPRTT